MHRKLKATINTAVSAQNPFAMSYCHIAHLLKVGPVVNEEGLFVMDEYSLPWDSEWESQGKEGIGRTLACELEALGLFLGLGVQPYWTLASFDTDLSLTLTLTLGPCWSPHSSWNCFPSFQNIILSPFSSCPHPNPSSFFSISFEGFPSTTCPWKYWCPPECS